MNKWQKWADENVCKIDVAPACRVVWHTAEARRTWEPIIFRISQAVQEAELTSVEKGQRAAAWRTIARTDLPEFAGRLAERGMIVSPVQFVGSWEGFVHYTPAGDSNVYCLIVRADDRAGSIITEYRKAFTAGDNQTQGRLLGFPSCCREFFAEFWAAGIFDPVAVIPANKIDPYSNPALRYIGVRFGFHIPCSFDCAATSKNSRSRAELLPTDLHRLACDLLSMPLNWSALHGLLQIETPLFNVIASTVPTKALVRREIRPTKPYWPTAAPECMRVRFT